MARGFSLIAETAFQKSVFGCHQARNHALLVGCNAAACPLKVLIGQLYTAFAMHNALLFLATVCLATASSEANAQALLAQSASLAGAASYTATPAEPTKVLAGRIANASGPLPGAVVTLVDSKQMAVTNSEGEFQFVVPVSARTLQAVVSFAGYADEHLTLNAEDAESTATLTDEQVIPLKRREQLRFYLKTAHKEIKHDLREVHRNMR
jgi:hypothetical protein